MRRSWPPPAQGETEHRWIGSYPATVHTNTAGTVLIKFPNSWDGLLYVPAGMEAPDRDGDLRIGPEVLSHWWYYNTDRSASLVFLSRAAAGVVALDHRGQRLIAALHTDSKCGT